MTEIIEDSPENAMPSIEHAPPTPHCILPTDVISPSLEELMAPGYGHETFLDEILDKQKRSFSTWMDAIVAHLKAAYHTGVGLEGMLENELSPANVKDTLMKDMAKLLEENKQLIADNEKALEALTRAKNGYTLAIEDLKTARSTEQDLNTALKTCWDENNALRARLAVLEDPAVVHTKRATRELPPRRVKGRRSGQTQPAE